MSPACDDPRDAPRLQREAADALAEAHALVHGLHLPGARDRHRDALARAIDLANRSLAVCARDDAATIAAARRGLLAAHAARARDARHGVGQLSRGAQRAPTPEACDDGWRRVEGIAAVAEASAAAASRIADALAAPSVRAAARSAQAAALEARRIVDARNPAYTFHTDPGFSFGEGWHLAAAAVLAGVAIQIEADKPHTAGAERFLRDAGLGAQLVPYRPRPRANKQLTAIVASAFRADPAAAQRRLRAAFLGAEPVPPSVAALADRALAGAPAAAKVLVWIRRGVHHATRNTTTAELAEIASRARHAGLVPVLFGDAVPDGHVPAGALDMTLCWREPALQGDGMRRAQLQLFEHLRRAHAVVGQLGVTTAGMDGPALLGLPTTYLTETSNVRMQAWVGAVPGYGEIVRGACYLERVSDTLGRWAPSERR